MARKLGPTEYYKKEFKASMPDADGFRYSTDGKRLFRAPSRLKEYAIPEGVEAICDDAFKGRVTYKKLIFPTTLKHIGKCAFMECRKLSQIGPGDNLESVGDYAFSNSGIKTFAFPLSCRVSEKAFEEIPVIVNYKKPKKEKESIDRNISYILCAISLVIVLIPLLSFYKFYGLNWVTISAMVLAFIWLIFAIRFLTFKESISEYKEKKKIYGAHLSKLFKEGKALEPNLGLFEPVPNTKEEKGCLMCSFVIILIIIDILLFLIERFCVN